MCVCVCVCVCVLCVCVCVCVCVCLLACMCVTHTYVPAHTYILAVYPMDVTGSAIVIVSMLALRIRIILATFLRDVTATFLSVTDTNIRTYIMRIDPGLESSLCSQ